MLHRSLYDRRRKISTSQSILFLLISIAGLSLSSAQEVELKSNFDNASLIDNPWAGVNGGGVLSVFAGKQISVDDSGNIVLDTVFPPSVAVGDLNGDGLPDLVIGDSRGFFWYFANSGTAAEPKFTHGEIMPIWLGFQVTEVLNLGPGDSENNVPKIQLVDLQGDKKVLSIVAGNFLGRLFYFQNQGTAEQPLFHMPENREHLIIPTRKYLWCNYLSPFLYDWFGTGNLDLIMGDGSYSANSIYLFKNQGARDQPTFNENGLTKLIPGMGHEHLTPQVVDWNNDGKHDIIAGDRTGHISLYLNSSADPTQPSFDKGNYVTLGGTDTFGEYTTVTVCDLSGNKLPNLIITNGSGAILYAKNIGKPGKPLFSDPVPIRGTNPFPQILKPLGWTLNTPSGIPHELLVTTNAKMQPDFIPPPNTNFTSALRYWVYPVKNTYFKDFYYPKEEGPVFHTITCDAPVLLKESHRYKLSFLIRTTGAVTGLTYQIRGFAHFGGGAIEQVLLHNSVDTGEIWHQYEDSVRFELQNQSVKDLEVSCGFQIIFTGQGEIYLDDVQIVSDE